MDWTLQLLDALRTAVAFVFILTILVVVHELGHFVVARLCGIRVTTFAVFMGGLRHTDLTSQLDKPLGSKSAVVATGLVGLGLILIGFIFKLLPATIVGLLVAGPITAAWTASRVERLYHCESGAGLKHVGFGLALGVVLLMFSKNLRVESGVIIAMVLAGGAWLAFTWLYYLPLRAKLDEDRIGKGSISYGSDEKVVPVDFRPLWSTRTKAGIDIALLVFPVGGFVTMAGMAPDEHGNEVKVQDGFYSVSPFKRLLTLAAGPAASLILGVGLIAWANMIQGVADTTTLDVQDVALGSPAAKAGIVASDKITAINTKAVFDRFELAKALADVYQEQAKTEPVTVSYIHAGQLVQARIVPLFDPAIIEDNSNIRHVLLPRLGIVPKTVTRPVTLSEALTRAILVPVDNVAGLLHTARNPSEIQDNLAGPATMTQVAATATRNGLGDSIAFAGLLSCSLGIMNLLPAFPLDGGQMVVAFLELLRGGRRLSFQIQSAIMNLGVLMVGLLVLTAWVVDLTRVRGGSDSEKNLPIVKSSQIKDPRKK